MTSMPAITSATMNGRPLPTNQPSATANAADCPGGHPDALETGIRLRSGAELEADVVLLLNDKYDVVARHHLVYDVGNAERFRDWAVLTIEKNRTGLDRIDLEFHKRFDQGRFDSSGQPVREQLIDERVFVE